MNISVIGFGIYSVALSLDMNENGHNVKIWSERNDDYKNKKDFAPILDMAIPEDISISNDIKDVLTNADLIVICTASKYVREVCISMKKYYNRNTPICIASKGIENDTLCFLDDVVTDTLHPKNLSVISGPTFAIDLINKDPVALAIASSSNKAHDIVTKALCNSHLKLRESKEMHGIELCGTIKNIIAIASGILDGLGYSDSTRAFLINESMHDIKELLSKLKCDKKVILSFAGIGDLILTSSSPKSRNYKFGVMLGLKKDKKEIDEYLNKNTTEGYYALLSIHKLVKNKKIDMPIINIIYDIAIKGDTPHKLPEFLINKA